MTEDRTSWLRMAVLARLVKDATKPLGRTALMKLAYFLQTVRNVPLAYHFTLYTFGPFDGSVLGDLDYACFLKAVRSRRVRYPDGNEGCRYEPGKELDALVGRVSSELGALDVSIGWVLNEFGHETAARLELLSTIVYVERECRRKGRDIDSEAIAVRVQRIKPHFALDVVQAAIRELEERGLIAGTSRNAA